MDQDLLVYQSKGNWTFQGHCYKSIQGRFRVYGTLHIVRTIQTVKISAEVEADNEDQAIVASIYDRVLDFE